MIAENINAVFKRAGQRNTRPRQLIAEQLALLASQNVHFSIDDLWQILRQQDQHLGRATLYRSIELLVNEGVLDRIDFVDGTHHYHVCSSTHQHVTCVQCHRFTEVHIALPADQMRTISAQTNFALESFVVTLFGRCANCRAS